MSLFAVGARVRLKTTADIFNLGVFPAGAAGTVIEADETGLWGFYVPDGYVGVVKLDNHFACLDEWDNCLHVYRNADETCEITEDLFEPCGF